MAKIDARGTHAHRLFVAACDDERNEEPPDEEAGQTLKQWRTDSEIVPLPNLAGVGTVNICAAESCKTCLDNRYGLQ